jgi:hypothetical protein
MNRWQKYRFLGADLQIRKLYQKLQIFECICYFAAFFALGFGVQVSNIREVCMKLIASSFS